MPALSCASLVEAPRCGVTTTLSRPNSGESVVGSTANTSSAAPPRWPSSSALASASSSTMPPRAVFTRRAPGFIRRELVLAEQPLGLRRPRQMDRHEVGLDQERLERGHRVDAHLLRALGAHVGIERDHAHAEPGGALGHERAHPAEPHEADRLAGELDALPLRALPRPPLQRGVGLRDVARLRQQQRHRLLGGADDVGLRRVDDHHPAARRLLDVDVVEPDPGARHHLQLWRGREHLGGDLRGAADDERVVRARSRSARSPPASSVRTSTWKSLRSSSSPCSESCSVTRTRTVSAPPGRPSRRRRRRRRASRGGRASPASSPAPRARG